jgi:hypothetical protein
MTQSQEGQFCRQKRGETRQFHLSFFFGDLCFYTKHFQAMIIPRPFDPKREAEECPTPPVELLPPDVDAVFCRRVPISAPLQAIRVEKRWIQYTTRQLDHYYTDLGGTFEDYLKKFTSKTRSELRRQVKVFTKFCGDKLDYRVYRTPEELEEFHPIARSLAKATYQERLFQGGLPDTEKFKERMRQLAKQNKAQGFLLFHGETPVAYLYIFATWDYVEGAFLGYDPRYKNWSPGTLLQYLALKDLFEQGQFRLYYWGYGEGEAKNKVFFSTGKSLCADIYYFRPTIRNLVAVHLHRVCELLSKRTGETLDKVNLRRRLKELLRRGTAGQVLEQRVG